MPRPKSVDAAKAAVDNAIDEYLRARFAEAITLTIAGIHPATRRRGRRPGPKKGSRRAPNGERAPTNAEKLANPNRGRRTIPPVVKRARKARAERDRLPA